MKTTNKVLSEEELEKAISSKRILTVKHYDELRNHADKLAEVLRQTTNALDPAKYPNTIAEAEAALAAYEKA